MTEDRDSTKRTLANVWQALTMRVTISAGLFGRAKQCRSLRPRNIPRVEVSRTHGLRSQDSLYPIEAFNVSTQRGKVNSSEAKCIALR